MENAQTEVTRPFLFKQITQPVMALQKGGPVQET